MLSHRIYTYKIRMKNTKYCIVASVEGASIGLLLDVVLVSGINSFPINKRREDQHVQINIICPDEMIT